MRPSSLPIATCTAYVRSTPAQIKGTLAELRYYRAFLASDCTQAKDPRDRLFGERLSKAEVERRLRSMIHCAINRKAWERDDSTTFYLTYRLNHRWKQPRYLTGDAQRHLRLYAYQINTPRLIVRPSLGEWTTYFQRRIPGRFLD